AAEQGQTRTAQARDLAEKADAKRWAPLVFTAAEGKEKDAQGALGRQEYARALQLFQAAQEEYQKAAEATRVALLDKEKQAALERDRLAAEQGRTRAVQAREQAEKADAKRWVASMLAAAEGKEKDAQGALGRQEYARALQIFQAAEREYQKAAQEAGKVAALDREKQALEKDKAALERDRQAAEQGQTRTAQAREQAEKADAKRWVAPMLAAAEGKEKDALAALGRQEYARAQQLFREAQGEYQKAAQEAQRQVAALEKDKSDADQVKERMLAAKRAGRTDLPDFRSGVAEEQRGNAAYQRLAYREAAGHYGTAQGLFAKATSGPDPKGDIRRALDDYTRAIETKDLALLQRVRPNLSPADVRRIQTSFQQSRSQKVQLDIQDIDISGDEAEVKGRRKDEFVPSSGGQLIRNEASFLAKLKRTATGWVIDEVR
ncbi:MAG: hypothetical protein ACRELA_11790, partial [Candidatus Rokuibacteriota bacterium]